ncbi:Lysophospholipid acyltransferase [Phytophthora cinnamomi]|uniref:Lysophospholipid acyltransferase n=1 Tax=Phytophthora cinnamomi TaxID=4785 RepID=UPI00355A8F19|nr:Lysophospholipid acyltransferase [Phytophthora cinnamomi]
MANNIPSEALKMLQLVYMKAIETQLDFSSLVSETSSRLCLPDYDCQGQNAKSSFPLNMLVEATCFLEERLSSHDLVKSFASTQEERLELVLVAVDDKIGALPHSLKIKWAKTIDMLSLLSKMREQTSSPASAPKLVTEEPEGLRQNNVLEKYLEAKQHREELEKRESKVHPSYVNGLTIEERLENLHVALAGNALPVDFHKKIGAMRNATEMKALDEQIKERKLLPAHFKRAKDGRIVVYPFQFATEIRAALSTDLKKLRTKPVHRPRDHVMKDLRPATYDREIPATVHPPQRKIHGRIEDTEADLCLDVHLSPSETRQLYLNMDDDPREVVDNFAKRFSLTNTQRHFLVQLVDARLGQFAT